MAFADIQDAKRSWSFLVKRRAWYGLTLHSDKHAAKACGLEAFKGDAVAQNCQFSDRDHADAMVRRTYFGG